LHGGDISSPVFWFVTPFCVVVGYQRFRDPCCLHLYPECNCMDLWKVGILPQRKMVSQPRGPLLDILPSVALPLDHKCKLSKSQLGLGSVVLEPRSGAAVAQSVQWLGYRLDDRDAIPGRVRMNFLSSPLRLNWLWGPPILLSSRYRVLFSRV